jgi:hypothetical protein
VILSRIRYDLYETNVDMFMSRCLERDVRLGWPLLSETLGTRHVSEIGIFRISEW